jgi:hypothetical protein
MKRVTFIKVLNSFESSFRPKPESSDDNLFWMPPHRGAGHASQVRHDESDYLRNHQNFITKVYFSVNLSGQHRR